MIRRRLGVLAGVATCLLALPIAVVVLLNLAVGFAYHPPQDVLDWVVPVALGAVPVVVPAALGILRIARGPLTGISRAVALILGAIFLFGGLWLLLMDLGDWFLLIWVPLIATPVVFLGLERRFRPAGSA